MNSEQLKNIIKEVEIMTLLSEDNHPNIVKFIETYDDVKFMYIVMECCDQGDILKYFSEPSNQTDEKLANVIMQIVEALAHLHSKGIAHRDIKPENLLFNNKNQVKIIDFGLSVQNMNEPKDSNTIAGTRHYVSPEAINGMCGTQGDMWSLGVVMYQLVFGIYPFSGERMSDLYSSIKFNDLTFPDH